MSLPDTYANTLLSRDLVVDQSNDTSKMNPDYEKRAQEYGFASPEEVRQALSDDNGSKWYVLDTRTVEEIAADGGVSNALQTNCTAVACPNLTENPEKLLPDKKKNILIYCRSGRRASKAKEILIQQGYQGKILNAGGYSDVVSILGKRP